MMIKVRLPILSIAFSELKRLPKQRSASVDPLASGARTYRKEPCKKVNSPPPTSNSTPMYNKLSLRDTSRTEFELIRTPARKKPALMQFVTIGSTRSRRCRLSWRERKSTGTFNTWASAAGLDGHSLQHSRTAYWMASRNRRKM